MVKLAGARIEVRIPGVDLDDAPVLQGRIARFHFEDIVLRPGDPGTRGRGVEMSRPIDPVIPPDDRAVGDLRAWRCPRKGGPRQGLAIYARNLTPEEAYEVHIEDPTGVMQATGSLESTLDGLGYWSVDTGVGDDLPVEAGEDDVRRLKGRRVELRRSGFSDPSLIGIVPRIR